MRLFRLIKVISAIFIIILASSGAAFCDQADPKGAVPKIHVPEQKYEFPMVVEGREVVHEFVVRNKGGATLDIVKVKPG